MCLRASIMSVVLGCLAVSTGGCSEQTENADESSTALEANASSRATCLVPADHPFNLNGDAWSIDGHTIKRVTVFYWHGVMLTMGALPANPPRGTWKIMREWLTPDHFIYQARNTSADVGAPPWVFADLTGTPNVGPGLTGTIRITSQGGSEETVHIIQSRSCPATE